IVELLTAEVVLASLHKGDPELGVELLKERDVLVEKLLLQIFGSGGNHHASAAADHRHEVSQSLPSARASLNNQVSPVFQPGFHFLGHLELARSILVTWMVAGEPAVRSEDALEGRSLSQFAARRDHTRRT